MHIYERLPVCVEENDPRRRIRIKIPSLFSWIIWKDTLIITPASDSPPTCSLALDTIRNTLMSNKSSEYRAWNHPICVSHHHVFEMFLTDFSPGGTPRCGSYSWVPTSQPFYAMLLVKVSAVHFYFTAVKYQALTGVYQVQRLHLPSEAQCDLMRHSHDPAWSSAKVKTHCNSSLREQTQRCTHRACVWY